MTPQPQPRSLDRYPARSASRNVLHGVRPIHSGALLSKPVLFYADEASSSSSLSSLSSPSLSILRAASFVGCVCVPGELELTLLPARRQSSGRRATLPITSL